MSPRTLRIALYIFVPLILVIISTSWIFEWLWMDNLGYTGIYWTLKGTKVGLLMAAFLVAAAYLVPNFRLLTDRLKSASFIGTPLQELNIGLLVVDDQDTGGFEVLTHSPGTAFFGRAASRAHP